MILAYVYTMSDIARYLVPDEKILEEWTDKNRKIYATNKRVLIKKGRQVSDYSYSHISSIDYESKIRGGRIIGGIVLIILGIIMFINGPVGIVIGFLLIIIAIILFLTSFTRKTMVYVIGRDPIELSGKMESLLRWIRQYKTEIEQQTIPRNATAQAVPITPKILETPPIREELLRSAMKALENGDNDLARKFLEQARLS